MYAKWQVFLHTGSCLNGEKGILLSPITKVFKKNCFILECGVSYIASCDTNCDISYVIVNTNFRVYVCQMAGILHTGSYLNGEKCIYKSVQRIVSSLIAMCATASYNKDCEIFLCICKYQFSTLSNGKFVLVTSAYMAQTIFLGLYLFTIVNLCNQYSPSFLDRFCY